MIAALFVAAITSVLAALLIGGGALSTLLGLIAGIFAGAALWRELAAPRRGSIAAAGVGGLVGGGIGFVAGFLGPLVFAPDANQGPLLGLLITGPAGVLLGAIAGAWSRRGREG